MLVIEVAETVIYGEHFPLEIFTEIADWSTVRKEQYMEVIRLL